MLYFKPLLYIKKFGDLIIKTKGEILSAGFIILIIIYLESIENKTYLDNILLFVAYIGFIIDLYITFKDIKKYLNNDKK